MSAPIAMEAVRAADRLRQWLLYGPAQIRSGPETGGVAGVMGEDGRPAYVYGEITGYFLHWLATPHMFGQQRLSEHALLALGWVERHYGAGELPPTRIYLDAAVDDWRNDAQFFFDLAMLVGGLSAAAKRGLIPPPTALLRRLAEELARFVVDGRIVAMRGAQRPADLPQRWSTLGGPFEVKAASRVLMAAPFVELPSALAAACAALMADGAARCIEAPVEMLHPTLYYLEGSLLADPAHRPGVAALLSRLLQYEVGAGELPEAPDSPVRRSDVIAQALRVGLFLAQERVDGAPDVAALDRLAAALIARVRPDGAIAFRPDAESAQLNTWCAMFGVQALAWFARWRTGHALDVDASAII